MQETSSESDSGQFEIPSDILNDRKLPERLWFRCVAAAPFDTLKLQKLRNNKGNNKAKPSGASRWFPPPEAISETPPLAEMSAISSEQRRRWQSEPGLGFGDASQVVRTANGHDQEKERRKREKKVMFTKTKLSC